MEYKDLKNKLYKLFVDRRYYVTKFIDYQYWTYIQVKLRDYNQKNCGIKIYFEIIRKINRLMIKVIKYDCCLLTHTSNTYQINFNLNYT